MGAELRVIERDVASVEGDIRALARMSNEEVKMSVADRIAAEVAQRRMGVDAEREGRLGERQLGHGDGVVDDDADTTGDGDERDAVGERGGGVEVDRPVAVRTLSLEERIAAETARLKANRDEKRRGGTDGRSR